MKKRSLYRTVEGFFLLVMIILIYTLSIVSGNAQMIIKSEQYEGTELYLKKSYTFNKKVDIPIESVDSKFTPTIESRDGNQESKVTVLYVPKSNAIRTRWVKRNIYEYDRSNQFLAPSLRLFF